ncbi:MAG: NAD(P)/FAD-dependent oxidoreductase [Peptoniphilus sp.]|nr:NAD(P)/FAD-dependent oxidoreductase [Peptoniphilus sp.]MDD7362925.1 NAD(P)/FAD-dependent oxidoreductase [Bacillota bacterium]MDY6044165.1 NAD(P)/FAD-dependent oxidoreductase [Peptoniphilus sp.]
MIIVVGGGPSGMMAAIKASEKAEVALIEKNEKLGKKLFITGKGRCNLCNDCDDRFFFDALHRNSAFMYSSYYTFSNETLKNFFEVRRVPLKVERGERVFPISDKSSDIIRCLSRELKRSGVDVHLDTEVSTIRRHGEVFEVSTNRGIFRAEKVIVATGGVTYPATGSTGDGYTWAKSFGMRIVRPIAGLVGLRCDMRGMETLSGLSLKNVELYAETERGVSSEFGEMLFTHYGISGPIVLSLSSRINRDDRVKLRIDLKPALDREQLTRRILREIDSNANRELKTIVKTMVPRSLVSPILDAAEIPEDLPGHQLSVEMRERLIDVLKAFPIHYKGLFDESTGIVTTGGVDVDDIDPSTMESRTQKGLYLCGELIDVDGPTGGFNLQIAFSTGYLAGLSAAEEDI